MSGKLKEKEYWEKEIGLISTGLFSNNETAKPGKYLMLNGTRGNFCLDISEEPQIQQSQSWSSNVDYFIAVDDNSTSIKSWDGRFNEKYTNKSIIGNLEKFHEFLCTFQPLLEYSIIAHSLDAFKNLRKITTEKFDNLTLDTFLLLLLALKNSSDIDDATNIKTLGLNDNDPFNTFLSNNQYNLNSVKENFEKGFDNLKLNPNIDLVLRHAMGQIFQETNLDISLNEDPQQSLWGGQTYSTSKPPDFTSYFTPSYIVRHLVDETLGQFWKLNGTGNIDKIRIMDPACGSGEFLKEASRQLRQKGFHGEIELIGYDISENAVKMTKFMLNYEKNNDINLNFIIEPKDALDFDWNDSIDIVLMNPPFKMWEALSNEEQNKIETKTEDVFQGRFNLAAAFLYLAVKSLTNNGVLGAVLPTFILDGNAYKKLRDFIYEQTSINFIGKLGSQNMFIDAMADVSVITLSNTRITEQKPIILWSKFQKTIYDRPLKALRKLSLNELNLPLIQIDDIDIYEKKLTTADDLWLPIPYNSMKLIDSLRSLPSITEIFETNQGAITGNNKTFILAKKQLEELPETERAYFKPAAVNDSIFDGMLNDDYYVFFPYGENSIDTKENLKGKLPEYFAKFLEPNKQVLEKRGLPKWWELTRPRVIELSSRTKLITKKFGSIGSVAYDSEGKFVAIEGSILYFKDSYVERINSTSYSVEDFYYSYLTVLSMPIIIDILEGISKQLAGAQWYYLAVKFLNEMHLPDLMNFIDYKTPESDGEELLMDKLIEYGKAISTETVISDLEAELQKLQKVLFPFSR